MNSCQFHQAATSKLFHGYLTGTNCWGLESGEYLRCIAALRNALAPLPTYERHLLLLESWPERSGRPAALERRGENGVVIALSSMPAAIVAVV